MRRLRILEAYREVAALGSVTAAARALGVSQPTVSRMIRELERELGQTLFKRAGQRLVLTAPGMALRDDVDRALGGLSEMWDRARELGCESASPLRVSAVAALAFGLLPLAWGSGTDDDAAGQGVRGRLVIRVETPDQVQADVVMGAARIGATSAPLLHRDLSLEWLGTVPCVLAVPDEDALAAVDGPVPLSALAGRPMVGLSLRRGLPARIRTALRRAGVEPQTVIRTNSTMSALSFIRAGAGVGIVEPLTPAGMPAAGVRLLPLAVPIPYCFGVVGLRGAGQDERTETLTRGLLRAAHALSDFTPVEARDHHAFLASLSQEETA